MIRDDLRFQFLSYKKGSCVYPYAVLWFWFGSKNLSTQSEILFLYEEYSSRMLLPYKFHVYSDALFIYRFPNVISDAQKSPTSREEDVHRQACDPKGHRRYLRHRGRPHHSLRNPLYVTASKVFSMHINMKIKPTVNVIYMSIGEFSKTFLATLHRKVQNDRGYEISSPFSSGYISLISNDVK